MKIQNLKKVKVGELIKAGRRGMGLDRSMVGGRAGVETREAPLNLIPSEKRRYPNERRKGARRNSNNHASDAAAHRVTTLLVCSQGRLD